jgi:phosphate transport system substrate-binding protein
MLSSVRIASVLSSLLGLLLFSFGCSKKEPPAPDTKASVTDQPAAKAEPVTLQGSGASFPAPLYSRWFKEFSDKHPDVRVNYQATGSGAGIKAFTEGQVDFGASDAAMTDEEIQQAKSNVVLLPVTAGQIVLIYNLEGVPELKLGRDAYAGLFLGQIKKWNDPKIAATNPGTTRSSAARTAAERPSFSRNTSRPSAKNGSRAPEPASPSTFRWASAVARTMV